MNKKRGLSAISFSLIFAILITTIASTFAVRAALEDTMAIDENAYTNWHDRIDISQVINEGDNPDEITGNASSLAAEKMWYEYITYSSEAVGTFKLNDNQRVVFYDPYDYSNALIMSVDESLTEWSTSNDITIEYSTSNSMSGTNESSTSTDTSIEQAQGKDESYEYSEGTSVSTTRDWSEDWSISANATTSATLTEGLTIGATAGFEELGVKAEASTEATIETSITVGAEVGTSSGGSTGGSTGSDSSTSESKGWSKVADRISKSTGSSFSSSTSWSTDDSKSISMTYNAAYFNESGSPLSWKVITYKVYMPMYYETQYLVDDEWVTIYSSHCLLVTIQGSCRAWRENEQTTYYEHWATGEKVTWDGFWGTFFTVDSLKSAYNSKLYPTNY